MTMFRSFTGQNIQNYPRIQIDRGSVIKPCNADQNAADQFIDKQKSSFKKILHDVWHEGIPYILRYISTLKVRENSSTYYIYLTSILKYIALLMLHIHRVYLYIYGYFFPYSLMPLDDVCDEFSRCPKWSESVVRAFTWHPNHDRCAVAICNDYIYVYQGSTRIRVLRHAQQRKITDMVWQPTDKNVLVVATQMNIIIWRVTDNKGGPLAYIRDSTRNPNFTYLAPGLHLINRVKESHTSANSSVKHDLSNDRSETSIQSAQTNEDGFKLLEHILSPPIISLQFDQSGSTLYACSPNSFRIAIIDLNDIFGLDTTTQESEKKKDNIRYMTKYGQGVTKILWSPEKNRLATATTSTFFRVFEPIKWSYNKWTVPKGVVQDMVWSKPTGRMLLIANKSEPLLYALPFLDNPQAGDVGGNKSLMKALDLTATRGELGNMVGGIVQSLVWDKSGKRLAISFKENPESILLYRTVEKPTVEFHQLGVIQSDNDSTPLLMEFHDNYQNGSLLTICWSDGNCQHIPLNHMPNELNVRNGFIKDGPSNSFNHSVNNSFLNDTNSSPKTARSLTNFCHTPGNNSISSYPSSLMPINKVQHQVTLFSLSAKLPLEASKNTSDVSEN